MEYARNSLPPSARRVRQATPDAVNRQIDETTDANIRRYTRMESAKVLRHISDLDREWDIERMLEVNAATLMLTGIALGLTVNKKWLALPAVVSAFLLQHGLQGWCPPLPLLRRLGYRTRSEIEHEKYILKAHLSPID